MIINNMPSAIIGTGRLGICTALILEKAGYNIDCYDVNDSVIKALNSKEIISHEKNVSSLLANSKNIVGYTSMKDIMHNSIFFCIVATPSKDDGSYNHDHVNNVVDEMLSLLPQYPGKKLLNICCTTMPGFCESVQEKFKDFDVDVCYNPEFIAQGDILHGFTHPDIVLVGETSKEAGDTLEAIYKNIIETSPTYCRMSLTEAEITKISINCFITNKISFANMIGDLCVSKGLRPENVLKAISSDSRVGRKYFTWGHGYGGPCFPRDNRALSFYFNKQGLQNLIGESTDTINKKHIEFLARKLREKKAQLNKQFLFRSLAYKPGTTILEESQSLHLALYLKNGGDIVYIQESDVIVKQLKSTYSDAFVYLDDNIDESKYIIVDNTLECIL